MQSWITNKQDPSQRNNAQQATEIQAKGKPGQTNQRDSSWPGLNDLSD